MDTDLSMVFLEAINHAEDVCSRPHTKTNVPIERVGQFVTSLRTALSHHQIQFSSRDLLLKKSSWTNIGVLSEGAKYYLGDGLKAALQHAMLSRADPIGELGELKTIVRTSQTLLAVANNIEFQTNSVINRINSLIKEIESE